MGRWLRRLATILLFAVVGLCLAVTVIPHYLDRIYYRGRAGGHFDGARFFNPDGEDTARPPGGGSRAGFFWRYLVGDDDRPRWPNRVQVARTSPPQRVTGDRMVATWVGHATVLVQANGLNILTDPVWSDTAGPFGLGPRRVAEPGIAFDALPPIDLVLVSHNHYDHLDLTTLKRLWDRDHPRIVTSLGNDSILRDAGIGGDRLSALDWGGSLDLGGGTQVIVTRNHHWGSRWFTDRNRALWSSFVVRLRGGNLFFAGDTGAGDYRWANEARRLGPIRLALIPIGAFRFEEGQMGTGSHIGPVDAVEIFRRLGATTALPIHWGTFRLSWEGYLTPPRLLAVAMRCAGLKPDAFNATPLGRPTEIPALFALPPTPIVDRNAMLACLDTPRVRALR